MIDPVLRRLAEEPEKLFPDQILWFATTAGIFFGHPISQAEAVKLSADEEGESLGDYLNLLAQDKAKHDFRPFTDGERRQGSPLHIFMHKANFLSGGKIYKIPTVVLYIEFIIAWAPGIPQPMNP
jgi:hypothetical protein